MLFDTDNRPSVILRDYQDEMREKALENVFVNKHRGTLCVSPMGSGKSICMASTAVKGAEISGRGSLILAHLKGLVRSNRAAVQRLGRTCYTFSGDEKDVLWSDVKNGAIVSGSVQAFGPKSLAKIPKDSIGLVLIDEGHHATIDSMYADIVAHFGCPVILFSATPDRADGEPLVSPKALCESVAYNGQVRKFVQDGWILKPKIKYDVTIKLDFSAISSDNSEITEKECVKIWEKHKSDYAVIKPLIEKHQGMQTVGFAPSVKLAKLWASLVNDAMPGKADYVASYKPGDYTDAKMDFGLQERRNIERQFEEKILRFMFNQGVFLEGADLVAAQLCMVGIFTKSRSKYVQIVGRVLRPCNDENGVSILSGLEKVPASVRLAKIAASHKPHAVVLDYGGSSGNNKLKHPVDLWTENHPDKVREIAKEIVDEQIRKGRDPDIEEAVQDAEDKYKRFLVRDARIRQSIAVECETVTRDIDPWGGEDVTGRQRYVARAANPASPKIVDSIRRMTRELGKTYSEDFFRSLTGAKARGVMNSLRNQVMTKRSRETCPSWIVSKLRGMGIYDSPRTARDGYELLYKHGRGKRNA